MKKIIYFLCVLMLFGCSSNDDVVDPTIIPLAPSSLEGTINSNIQVTLDWTYNSTNETGFKIERKSGTGNYTQIASVNRDITTYVDNSLTASSTYTYRLLAYNSAGNSLTYSNQVTIITTDPISIPVITTNNISSISSTTAICGGDVSSDGGSTVTEKGVVWSTSPNPTISLTTKTANSSGVGSFSNNISPLILNVKYYCRAYATNSVGTAYGNEISFITSYAIGETGPAGGYIFYDKGTYSDGWRYLEANYADYPIKVAWWSGTWTYKDMIGISPNESLGSGKTNTLLIMVANNNLYNAAKVCNDYSYNSYTDWYLPSSEELKLICQNLHSAGKGNLTSYAYWSSTNTNLVHSATWMQFSDCYLRTDWTPNEPYGVRPVRQF